MNGINEKSKQAQDNNRADFFLAIGYVFDDEVICQLSCFGGAAQRFDIDLRVDSAREQKKHEATKMRHASTCLMHILLGVCLGIRVE